MHVLWFGYMEAVVCNGDNLILNSLFNFERSSGSAIFVKFFYSTKIILNANATGLLYFRNLLLDANG